MEGTYEMNTLKKKKSNGVGGGEEDFEDDFVLEELAEVTVVHYDRTAGANGATVDNNNGSAANSGQWTIAELNAEKQEGVFDEGSQSRLGKVLKWLVEMKNWIGCVVLYVCMYVGFCAMLPFCLVLHLFFGSLWRLINKVAVTCEMFRMVTRSRVFNCGKGNQSLMLVVCKGFCNIDHIQNDLMRAIEEIAGTTRMKKYGWLQQRVRPIFGYLFSEDKSKDFDIKNHVKFFNPRVDRRIVTNLDVNNFVSQHLGKPWAMTGDAVGTVPQWEVLLIPDYMVVRRQAQYSPNSIHWSSREPTYAMLIRYHNGLCDQADWNKILASYWGGVATRERREALAAAEDEEEYYRRYEESRDVVMKVAYSNCRMIAGVVLLGPVVFLKKLLFSGRKLMVDVERQNHNGNEKLMSVAMSKAISEDALVRMGKKIGTSVDSIVGCCIRTGIKNAMPKENVNLPKKLNVTRLFEENQVDNYSVEFRRAKNIIERILEHFQVIDQVPWFRDVERQMNDWFILMAASFPVKIAEKMHQFVLKGDVLLENWEGQMEVLSTLGGTSVSDICGWSGLQGCQSDVKFTISKYAGRVRVNFLANPGAVSTENAAEKVIDEFLREFECLAIAAGVALQDIYLDQ